MKNSNLPSTTKNQIQTLEGSIEADNLEIRQKELKAAKNYGIENRPSPQEKINPFIRPTLEAYALLFNRAKKELKTILLSIETEMEIAKSAVLTLSGQKQELQKNINLRKSALEDLQTSYPWKLLPFILLFAGLILAAEITLNSFAFAVFGDNFLFSLLTSFGISFALLAVFHLFLKSLSYAKTLLHKIMICIGWALIITWVFYYLGLYREIYMQRNGIETNLPLTGFVLFNWFLLWGASYILSNSPSWQQITNKYQHIQKTLQMRKLEQSLLAIDKELQAASTKQDVLKIDKQHITNKETEMEPWIVSMMRKTLADWRNENIAVRSDGFSDLNTIDQNDFMNTNNLNTQLQ